MVSKTQLAQQVRDLAARHSPDFNATLPEIALLVGQLRDEALVAEYYQMQQLDGREVLAELVNTFYDLPVRDDAQRGREYVVLPAAVLALPGGRGVLAVFPSEGPEPVPLLIIPTGTPSLLGNHPAARLQGRLGCWVEAGRGAEPGRLWMAQDGTGLLHPALTVQLVVAAAHVGDDLPCPLPAHLQTRVVNAAVERLLKRPAEDRVADNRDQA